jgi:hypothetical protein
MLQNSKYSVWFKTPQGEGHGVISLMDGNLSGGDNVSNYTGAYVQDGDKFAATIAVRRLIEQITTGPRLNGGVPWLNVCRVDIEKTRQKHETQVCLCGIYRCPRRRGHFRHRRHYQASEHAHLVARTARQPIRVVTFDRSCCPCGNHSTRCGVTSVSSELRIVLKNIAVAAWLLKRLVLDQDRNDGCRTWQCDRRPCFARRQNPWWRYALLANGSNNNAA